VAVSYQQEFLSQVEEDIKPLLEKDWLEIEHNKSVKTLDPDWDAYYNIESSNMLRIFTARDNIKLVGYFVVLLIPSLHNKGLVQGVVDIIYLDKEYRKGFTGYKLFKFSEKCLREDNIKVIHVTTTEVNPIDPILDRLGYSKIETKFEKVL
tara:strand:- start:3332 stop:3784 length:453 start_codon:yes stop_codon:yes gene_type:complete